VANDDIPSTVSERALSAVLDSAAAAICLLDEQHHCVYLNAAARTLTGYALAELSGQPFYQAVRAARPDGTPLAFVTNERAEGEAVITRTDGERCPVSFAATPLRDRKRDVTGTILELRDISAEKKANEARQLLMRGINHRAKNVLAVAQGIVRLTKARELPDYQTAIAGRIDSLARAHIRLAREHWEGAPLGDVVQDEVRALARPEAFAIEGPDLLLSANAVQPLGLMLHELATNTAKYGALSTSSGSVSLSWTVTSAGELEIVWRESGGPKVAAPERTGFGSNLLRQLARQLGGDVTLDWREDGLIARLLISEKAFSPPSASPSERRVATARATRDERVRSGRVLVLEDNATIGLGMCDLLAAAGLEVLGPAMNLDEAIAHVLNSRIDAVFLDIELYGYPSFEVADTLAVKGIPFVFCTGHAELVRGSRHNGRRILRKPVTDEEVLAALDEMIGQAARARL
jgi:PAS domain S-box-containing protein